MINSILIDSGPIIALFDRDDAYHYKVKDFIKDNKFHLLTTTAVVTEVSHMLSFNINVQISFLEWIMRDGITIFEIKQNHISRIIELTRKYSDLPMDFADATLVIAAEHTKICKIISIDSDFDIYRLPGKELIQNLLFK